MVGDHVFLADGTGGFHVLDVSNPATPFRWVFLRGSFHKLEINGNYAFSDGQIIDISNTTAPGPVTAVDTPGDFALAHSLAYVGSEGLMIYRFGHTIGGQVYHPNGIPAGIDPNFRRFRYRGYIQSIRNLLSKSSRARDP